MQVYQTDRDGWFIGVSQADPDPMDAGNWLIPGGCITVAPPALDQGQKAQWTGNAWAVVDPEPDPEPVPEPEPTPEEIAEKVRRNRTAAYTEEADPIFFKYQRGEATEQDWLDKVEEIRARYPYPGA